MTNTEDNVVSLSTIPLEEEHPILTDELIKDIANQLIIDEQATEALPGTQGPEGTQGATGATGPKGDKGDPGEKGVKGDTPELQSGEYSVPDTAIDVEVPFPHLKDKIFNLEWRNSVVENPRTLWIIGWSPHPSDQNACFINLNTNAPSAPNNDFIIHISNFQEDV